MKLDIIYTYFNQKEYTKEMLLYIDNYIDREFLKNITFTIVDDNSDFPLMDYLPDLNNLNLKIYRTDFDGYNPGGGYNLACLKAETNIIANLDMDMVIYNNFVERLLSITPTDEYYYRFYLERATKMDFRLGKIYYKKCGYHGLTTKTTRVKYLHDERFSGNWGYHGVFMMDCMLHGGIKELYIEDQRVIMPPRVYLNKVLLDRNSAAEYRKHETAGETPNLIREKNANKPLYDKLLKELKDGTYESYNPLNFNYELVYKNF